MSEKMKTHHTELTPYITVTVGLPGEKKVDYKIPNTQIIKDELTDLLKIWSAFPESLITPWEEAIPWEKVAADRIKKHKKAGLILRGARYREGISQKELAKRSGISQNNLSHMENGKRGVGKKTAKKIAEALNIDYQLLLDFESDM